LHIVLFGFVVINYKTIIMSNVKIVYQQARKTLTAVLEPAFPAGDHGYCKKRRILSAEVSGSLGVLFSYYSWDQ